MTNRPFYLIMLGGLLFFLALVFIVGGKPANEATNEAPVEEVAFDAAAQYAKSCAMCHGGNLEGASAPTLKGLTLTAEQIADAAKNGINTMPPGMFNGTEEERLALANWILEQK